MTRDLHAALLAAHATGDSVALVGLYAQAADQARDPDEAAFYLTQAYVFGLETRHPRTGELRMRLIAAGRESGDHPGDLSPGEALSRRTP